MWFLTRSDSNRHVQAQKRARSLKFQILVEKELYYPSSENKGADQLRGYREADLRLCFRICRLFVFPCGCSNVFPNKAETVFFENLCTSSYEVSPTPLGICGMMLTMFKVGKIQD